MILPAQFENEVRAGEEILFCPYCSRILFYAESEVEEGVTFRDEDQGSLADLFGEEEEDVEDDDDDDDDSADDGADEEEE